MPGRPRTLFMRALPIWKPPVPVPNPARPVKIANTVNTVARRAVPVGYVSNHGHSFVTLSECLFFPLMALIVYADFR